MDVQRAMGFLALGASHDVGRQVGRKMWRALEEVSLYRQALADETRRAERAEAERDALRAELAAMRAGAVL